MTQQQMNQLLEQIASHSHALCHLIQVVQGAEHNTSSASWLRVFDEITNAWFANDCTRLEDISNFVMFGTVPKSSQILDLSRMLQNVHMLTND